MLILLEHEGPDRRSMLGVAEVNITRSAPVKAMGSISALYGSKHQQTLKEVISLSASSSGQI